MDTTKQAKPIEDILKMYPFERLEYLVDNCPELANPYPELRRAAKAEIMHWYMNAVKTHYGAGGHGKAERNEMAAKNYITAMIKFEIPVPSNDICFILGQFNGEGSK